MANAVCVGEGLVVLTPADDGPLADVRTFRRSAGGAECNVAGGLAAAGIATSGLSRLGTDPFGDHLAVVMSGRGVDVTAVERDPDRPTGLYVKDTHAARMHYYRSGSAASALGPAYLERPEVAERLARADVVHTTGITAALSDGAAQLLLELAGTRTCPLSVDLNWRPQLWRNRDTGKLRDLLRSADVVLIGTDEAVAFAGTDDPGRLHDELLGPDATLVLKDGPNGVLATTADGSGVVVPALTVDVVEPVGAGDAFAAGYLAGMLDGLPMVQRLRLGHLHAAQVLAVAEDHASPPPERIRQTLLACSDDEWAGSGRLAVQDQVDQVLGDRQ